jgi:hypothetical protein
MKVLAHASRGTSPHVGETGRGELPRSCERLLGDRNTVPFLLNAALREGRTKTMNAIASRKSGTAKQRTLVLFAWAAMFLMAAVLCWSPQCSAASEKGEAAGPEITGPAIAPAPLHQAAGDGDLAQVKELLSKGTDVNGRDVLGSTALMFAALGGNIEVCKLLTENKADINAKNNDGVTALMFASAQGFLPVVEFLVEKGADVNVADKDGRSALSYAKADGREHVEKFLAAKDGKEPPDLGTMHWQDHRRCIRVPVCVRWAFGHCREWVYEVRCFHHHRHHHDHWR